MAASLVLLPSLLVAATWCAVLLAAGARARWLARLPVAPGLKVPVDFLLGAWVAAAAALLCGFLGLFKAPVLLSVGVGLAVAGRWRGSGWRWGPLLAALAPALLLLPVALAPPFFYDALVYHLGLPWQALMEGRLAPHPEDLFSAFPPLAQLVAAFPLSVGLDRVPALVHLASFAAAGSALAALARSLGAPAGLAMLGGAALPVLPAMWLVAGLPAAEGWTVVGVAGAMAVALGGGDRRARSLVAGILVGCASAARLQGLPWAGIVMVVIALRSRPRLRRVVEAMAGWLLGAAPWWLKNLVLLGNPLAPLGWSREGIQTLWRDAGTQMRLAAGAGDLLRASAGPLLDQAAYLAPLLLAGLLALRGGRGGRRLLLGAALLAGGLAWALTGTLPRFLAPTLACLLALAAAAGRSRPGRWAGGLALACTAALGLVSVAVEMGRLGGLGVLLADREVALERLVITNPLPAFEAARALPAGARVLFVGEARGFPFPRPFAAPSQHDASPLREATEGLSSAEALRGWILSRGYTHLLVNRLELARLAPRYPVLPWRSARGQRRFRELLRMTGPPVVETGGVGIFDLSGDARGTKARAGG